MKSLRNLRNVIISDFDETITNRDTISILGELPYYCKPNLKPEWSHFASTYMQNYQKFKFPRRRLPLISPPNIDITSSNFNELFRDELNYQTDARRLEISSTNEMAKYQIFANVTFSDVLQFTTQKLEEERFTLRDGFKKFIRSQAKDDFYIVSVNWSDEFIEASIGSEIISKDHIYCNRLLSVEGVYTGVFSNSLLTGVDKISAIDDIIAKKDTENIVYWYVGDSETDLLPILHPDVNGVLLLDPSENKRKFKKITQDILGLDRSQMESFAANSERSWLQCYEKNENRFVFIAKSWSSLENIHSS